jgi:hypothetical protein
MPRNAPSPCPSSRELHEAADLLGKVKLHFYQLLYFQQPQLTSPGSPAGPFEVRMHPEHSACVQFLFRGGYYFPKPEHGDYSFHITPNKLDDIEKTDAEVLEKCRMIFEAARAKKEIIDKAVCCPLAEYRDCVCRVSVSCPLHGQQCWGTHD